MVAVNPFIGTPKMHTVRTLAEVHTYPFSSPPLPRVSVVVHGTPAPQGSKDYVGSKYFAREASKRLPGWRADVREALCRPDGGPLHQFTGPVSASLRFALRRPKKSKYGEYPAGKPDLDKLTRAVLDAATSAGVLADDALVVAFHHLSKAWTEPGQLAGCEIEFRALET